MSAKDEGRGANFVMQSDTETAITFTDARNGRRAQDPLLSFDGALAELQRVVDHLVARLDRPRVLDAGCGAQMYLRLPAGAHVVGIDISEAQLDQNGTVDERIVGDIQTFPLPADEFDLVVCWDVLEHLRRPRAALDNLAQAVRRGGLLVIGGPNALSLKGLATWLTPFWAHQLWYRLSRRGHRPFRTYRRVSALPRPIESWSRDRFRATEYSLVYESPLQRDFRQRFGLDGRIWSPAVHAVRGLSGGHLDLAATDFMLVLRR
ncbi:MAG TPA: class I SAM-dependent methyltransferase [Solirubrobacteraceae bacterium]